MRGASPVRLAQSEGRDKIASLKEQLLHFWVAIQRPPQ